MARARAKKSSTLATAKEEEKKIKVVEEEEAAAAEEREEKKQWPSRERKQVERYFEPYPQKSPALKNPTIEQGPGKKLRDIPNVAFKLSKRKVDGNINVLHTILFGRKAHVNFLKRNILQFSGFVWTENEGKQKTKVREKLEKCTKDKLLDFCQLFDLPINKAVTKKDEATTMLLEFLQSPYIRRDVVLAEKEQARKKRKRTNEMTKATSEEAESSDREDNKKQSSKNSGKRRTKESAKANEDDEHGSDAGNIQEKDQVKSKRISSYEKQRAVGAAKLKGKTSFQKGSTDDKSTPKSALKTRPASQDESKALAWSKKVSFNEPTTKGSKSAVDEISALSGKDRKESKSAVKGKTVLSRKESEKASKRDPKSSKESTPVDGRDSASSTLRPRKADGKKIYGDDKSSPESKKAFKGKATKPKLSSKEMGRRKVQGPSVKGPSRKALLPLVARILKEVDFDTVTFGDILKQLESHFKVGLGERQAEVKGIIEEVILSMPDPDYEEDQDEEEAEEDPEEEDPVKKSDNGDDDGDDG